MKKILHIIITFLIIFNTNIVNAEETNIKNYGDRNNVENYGVVKRGITITDNNLPNILRTPYVNPNLKIYDYGEIFNDNEIETIYNKILDFKNTTNMEFIILTINDYFTDYENTTFATDFYDYNDFGLDTYNYDGILLLRNADPLSPFYNIYTFGEARLAFPDEIIETILDNIYDDFVSKNYLDGINKIFLDLNYYYDEDYESNYYVDDMGMLQKKFVIPYIPAIIIALIVTLITMGIMLSKHKMIKKDNSADNYIDQKNFKFITNDDKKIKDYTRSYSNQSSSDGFSVSGNRGSSGRGFGGGSGRRG